MSVTGTIQTFEWALQAEQNATENRERAKAFANVPSIAAFRLRVADFDAQLAEAWFKVALADENGDRQGYYAALDATQTITYHKA